MPSGRIRQTLSQDHSHQESVSQHSLVQSQIPIWLNSTEAANLLGVHVNSLRHWLKKGLIPAYKMGRNYRYDVRDLKEFARKQKVKLGEIE